MITEFKIEKGIELPNPKETKYPFAEMEVGDSFIFADYTRERMGSASTGANSWAKTKGNGWKFSVRKTADNKIRIWRTA